MVVYEVWSRYIYMKPTLSSRQHASDGGSFYKVQHKFNKMAKFENIKIRKNRHEKYTEDKQHQERLEKGRISFC